MHYCLLAYVNYQQKNNKYFSMYLHLTAAKSLQSCPTLCDPIDGSPPASPIPGILQARTLEWVAMAFSNAWKWKVKVKSLRSDQISRSVVSDSLRPHESQHARPPCPSPTPKACSNSCPSSQWCYTTISSSVVPFSSHLQSFPASGSFPMSQLFTSGGESIGVSASASVLPMNIQDWFPLGLIALISFQSKGLSRVFSNTTVQKHQFFSTQPSSQSNTLIHTWLLEKP